MQHVEQLRRTLDSLMVPTPTGDATSPTLREIAGRKYIFPKNDQSLRYLQLSRSSNADLTLNVCVADTLHPLECSKGAWRNGMLGLEAGSLVPMTGYLGGEEGHNIPVAVSGAWSSRYTYPSQSVVTRQHLCLPTTCDFLETS